MPKRRGNKAQSSVARFVCDREPSGLCARQIFVRMAAIDYAVVPARTQKQHQQQEEGKEELVVIVMAGAASAFRGGPA